MGYGNIPNRSPGGLDESLGGDFIRFREPGATLTNAIYKRNLPSKLGALLSGWVPLIGIQRYHPLLWVYIHIPFWWSEILKQIPYLSIICCDHFQRDMQKDQQRIRELEKKNEQQSKVLKVKTEEMVAVHKKLRSNNQMSRYCLIITVKKLIKYLWRFILLT